MYSIRRPLVTDEHEIAWATGSPERAFASFVVSSTTDLLRWTAHVGAEPSHADWRVAVARATGALPLWTSQVWIAVRLCKRSNRTARVIDVCACMTY